jgi:hypothetical protein
MAKNRSRAATLDYGRVAARFPLARTPRGTVIIIGLLLWLGLVFAYAGPMAASAVYCLIVDGGTVVLWAASAFGIGSILLPIFHRRDVTRSMVSLEFATATALGLGVISLLVLALGLAGWLNQWTAILLLALGLPGLGMKLARISRSTEGVRQGLSEPAGWAWLALLAAPLIAVMTVGGMMPPYVLWNPQEPHGYDVVEYHLQIPREWFEAGRIGPLQHNVFSFLPFNVEMHYLLAMHLRGGPWAGMYTAQFMHGAFILLTVLAVGAIAKALWVAESSKSRPRPAVVAVLAMASTPLLWQLGAIAYDEGGFLLYGILAIGWAILAVRPSEGRMRRLALAGVMAGLACGAKLTAVPEVLVAAALITGVLLIALRQNWNRAIVGVAIFGLCGSICFAPWLIRTWAWAGNPVFPELPQLGHGYFSPSQVERWRHAHAARPDQQSIVPRLKAGWVEVLGNWQYGFLLIPLALLAVAVNWRDPDVWFPGAMLFLLALFWLSFTHLQGRFFVLAVPVCALLVTKLPPRAALAAMAVQAVGAIVLLNVQFLTAPRLLVMHEALGIEDLSWLTPSVVKSAPPNATLSLVGDARAFVYQRPMAKLTYKTVFDADTSAGDVIAAWAGPSREGQWLLIDPVELERFAKTYPPFPPLPADVTAHTEPYVVRR